jgi:hypothetical protein
MNKDKVGESFRYPNIFLLLLGYAKVYFHLPDRQTEEGIAQGHAHGKVPTSIPDYTTTNRILNRLNINVEGTIIKESKDNYIISQKITQRYQGYKQRSMVKRQMEYKKERKSKNSHCSSGYKKQENSFNEGNLRTCPR